ncbi:MAG: hypothetical protein GQ558_10430 [Thermoplasmata archaeon]|nr:hypothetical protein [Thermoplasmata archaeon]
MRDGTPASNGVEELDAAIEAARRAGADVSEAEALSKDAKANLCLDREVEAAMLVQQGLDINEKAHRRRVERLLREARTVLEQEESKGVDTVDSWKQMAKAEDAFGASDYEATIWFLNMAIQSMGAAERLRNEAMGALAQNRWSIDKLSRLEPVSSPEVDLIQLQENLVAQGDFQGSLHMTEELEGRLAARLANHTGVLLGETRAHIDDLKHEDLMDEAKHAKDAYKLAQRYVREKDTRSAICIIMQIEMDHDDALRRRREILVVG